MIGVELRSVRPAHSVTGLARRVQRLTVEHLGSDGHRAGDTPEGGTRAEAPRPDVAGALP